MADTHDTHNALLVPMKVEALVIDDEVIELSVETTAEGSTRALPGAGNWTPRGSDVRTAFMNLAAPGPAPFFGAQYDPASQQCHLPSAAHLPRKDDRGVYLHWVLPTGMRHAHGFPKNELAFPTLPDQWLVLRFHRTASGRGANARAWFVDSSVLVNAKPNPDSHALPTTVLAPDKSGLLPRSIGRFVAFPKDFKPDEFDNARRLGVPITALGTAHTGSPAFTAFTPDNRNVLSFHDDLADLRDENDQVASGTTFSYMVMGWYRTAAAEHEPLKYVLGMLSESESKDAATRAVLKALGWQYGGEQRAEADPEDVAALPLPDDLPSWRTVFHGMVANINYYDAASYRGPLLGYPQLNPTVGIGNNAADALVALVADAAPGDGAEPDDNEKRALWKALEAVIYRQTQSLLGTSRERPREYAIHQSWFNPQKAGQIWNLAARTERPVVPAAATTDTSDAMPKSAELAGYYAALEQLNQSQGIINQAAQDLSALQQEFYAHWWLLAQKFMSQGGIDDATDGAALDALMTRGKSLQGVLDKHTPLKDTGVRDLTEELKPTHLMLFASEAPRFWQPADPVIVVQQAGRQDKHASPVLLACRPYSQTDRPTLTEIGVEANVVQKPPSRGLKAIKAAATKYLPAAEALTALMDEADLIEQTIHMLAVRTAKAHPFDTEADWRAGSAFMQRMLAGQDDAAPDADSADADSDTDVDASDDFPDITLSATNATGTTNSLPQLVSLWGKQPWNPLYLDWQITWYPDENLPSQFPSHWRFDSAANDYVPTGDPATAGKVIKGRSLMAPQMGRVFSDPIHELEQMLDGSNATSAPRIAAVVAVLRDYRFQWLRPLQALEDGGLLGQTVSGFHQALLGRDTLRPWIKPNTDFPWIPDVSHTPGSNRYHDGAIAASGVLAPAPLTLPGLAPPNPLAAGPFPLLQGGSFTVDALWIIDDFGQWLDLLSAGAEGYRTEPVVSPHCRWPGAPTHIVQPPRLLQPARLRFRFVDSAFKAESGGHPDSDPVCGWVFHNFQDRALALCDADGNLLGELVLVDDAAGKTARWECLQRGQAADSGVTEIQNPTLRAFASALVKDPPGPQTKLAALLAVIDDALRTIRPAAGNQRARLVGRPLALVNAQVGLELFGRAWDNPQDQGATGAASSGESELAQLHVPVRLGYASHVEDGLIGYYKRDGNDDDMGCMMAVRKPDTLTADTEHIGDAAPGRDAVRVGVGRAGDTSPGWQNLTLLMDPHGSVHASTGLLPAKALALPKIHLDRARQKMELSFRVAPLLLRNRSAASATDPIRLPVPLPVGWPGHWAFEGPNVDQAAVNVLPPDAAPDHGISLPMAVEGRLVLRKEIEDADGEKANHE